MSSRKVRSLSLVTHIQRLLIAGAAGLPLLLGFIGEADDVTSGAVRSSQSGGPLPLIPDLGTATTRRADAAHQIAHPSSASLRAVGDASSQKFEDRTGSATPSGCIGASSAVRIHVLLVPSEFQPWEHTSRVEAILETWGKNMTYKMADGRCAIWDVSLAHEGTAFESPAKLKPFFGEATPPPEVQAMGKTPAVIFNMLHVFSRLPQPDWIMKVDDCVFVLPENAIRFLSSYDAGQPLLLGSLLRNGPAPQGELFTSSAGFALSRGALSRIRDAQSQPSPSVSAWMNGPFRALRSAPDVGLSALCKQIGVELPDTRDVAGRERFNAFPIVVSVKGAYHDWFIKYKEQAGQVPQAGLGCCAADAVLFHYVGGADIRFLQDLIRSNWFAPASGKQRAARWPPAGSSLFDVWSPQLRPGPENKDPVWVLLESIQMHLRETSLTGAHEL